MNKLFLIGSVLGVLAVGPVRAADMPVKVPAYAAAPYYNWSGFYAGLQSGYGWASLPPLQGAPSPSGWFGGGQLGLNYQPTQSFVMGAEIDAADASLKDTTISLDTPGNIANTVSTAGTINFLGSVRARAGYAADRILIYGTGGFALAHAEFTSVMNGAPVAQIGTDEQFHDGWVAGAGVESILAGNWTAKLEYLYYRFGNETYLAPSATIVKFDVQTVKFGVNYLFR
jgi:outer membrane immunogenic protein